MLTHTGEKPFTCNYCNYSSITISNLRVHETTHIKTGAQILVALRRRFRFYNLEENQ
jgi:hypothetical protein